jgi:uncharacterized protein (UPF0335 family)
MARATQRPGIGHNSDAKKASETPGVAADRLRSLIERVERLEEEKKALANDIKDIYVEAKSAGFDTTVMRILVRLRKMDPTDIEEQETLLKVYQHALGM